MYIIHREHRIDKNAYEYDDKSVTVIREDRMRVRQTPLVYLPSIDKEGALHLVDEVVSNAIDEVSAPGSTGSEVIVTYTEKEKTVTVQDDGRGFPLNKLQEMVEVLNSSAKMGTVNRAYNQSGGLHGMGLKLCCFMTKWMNIWTEREGKKLELHYVDGVLKDKITGKSKDHGSYIEFQYDKRFFSDINVTCDDILALLQRKAYVSKGAVITFQGTNKKGNEVAKEFRGVTLKDYLKQFNISTPIVEGKGSFGDSNVTFMFGYDTTTMDDFTMAAYTNNIYNRLHGSHVDGLLEGISSALRDYMFKSYLSEKEKKEMKFKAEDFRAGLVGIVSLYTLNPRFRGQFKEILDDNNMKNFLIRTARATIKNLDSTKLNKLCLVVKTNAKARLASEMSKKRVRKDITNAFSSDKIESFVPISKYSKSSFREVFIGEGLSAKDGMRSASDDQSQAILALRGKIENVFDLSPEEAIKKSKFLEYMMTIFDCGIGKTFDISRFPYDRVNLATDADIDGADLAASQAMMFAVFFPEVVTSGRLYRVLPPLYEIKHDGKTMFISSNRELCAITQKNFAKAHTIYHNGSKLGSKEIIELLMRNERYIDSIDWLANQYAISPILCEFIIDNIKIGFGKDTLQVWNKKLKERFKFMYAEVRDDHVVLLDMIDTDYNNFDYTDEFLQDLKHITIAGDPVTGYAINEKTTKFTLYVVLELFKAYTPKIVERFKGLGQMSSDDLRRSVMNIHARRSIKLTMSNIKKTYAILAKMHSKKPAMTELRKKFMSEFKFDLMDIDT